MMNEISSKSLIKRNYVCVDCGFTIKNPRLFLEHRRDAHEENLTIHQCSLCLYASKHLQKLFRHQRTVHRSSKPMDHGENSSNFVSARNLHTNKINDLHRLTSSKRPSRRISSCKHCDFQSPNKSIMIDHIKNLHKSIEIFQCEQCDYVHYIRDQMNRHRRYHAMNFIQCNFCDFKTVYKWNMERHNRHHTDLENGFKCEICNFVASTRQSVTTHKSTSHTQKDNKKEINPTFELENKQNPIEYVELVWDNNEPPPLSSSESPLQWEMEPISKSTMYRAHIFHCQNCYYKNKVECKKSRNNNNILP